MNKPLAKELEELTQQGVISPETADNIRHYYKSKSETSQNKLFAVFAVIGSVLIGLGIILMVAHNWDDLSRGTKVFFSFLPLVAGQAFCFYSLTKKSGTAGWREGSAAFLFFSVGACISLISQVYNIHGELSTFLITWMLLCLPLIYIMDSSIVSLLYIAGITYYAVESSNWWSYWRHGNFSSYHYWWLLVLAMPYYLRLKNKFADSNAMAVHNWIVPLSLTFALGTMSTGNGNILYIGYMSLFGLFYLLGTSGFFQTVRRKANGFLVIGSLGTMQIMLMASFSWFWEDWFRHDVAINFSDNEFILSMIIAILALAMLYFDIRKNKFRFFHPMKGIFILFCILYAMGENASNLSLVLINLTILATGIFTVWHGAKLDHFGILNYGLLQITALVICRFFDSDMSFIVRGLLFIIVGAGFFAANYRMLQKRKKNELNL